MLFLTSLFNREDLSDIERAIIDHSPEVILQGLAEALPTRGMLGELYNSMEGLPANPLHKALAAALIAGRVPAVFTTNQDRCIEDIVKSPSPTYDEVDFNQGLHCNLFQFHGAIGGKSFAEVEKRKRSLAFTLNSMGPELPESKHRLLEEAVSRFTLIFLGYSGSDPDIWYSLDKITTEKPSSLIYWCIRGDISETKNRHIRRLRDRHPKSIILFNGEMVSILAALGTAWKIDPLDPVEVPTPELQEARLQKLRSWAKDLREDQRDLAYGWLLDSVGLHRQAAEELERLEAKTRDSQIHMLAALLAGFSRRELGEHIDARKHFQVALNESAATDRCRYAQAAQRMGESLSTFESVRFWHFWPTVKRLHKGAAFLEESIAVYETLPPDELTAKQLGRAGLGSAKMNLGQLYLRAAAYIPGLRRGLANRAIMLIDEAMGIIKDREKDLRSLPMALAAIAADNPTTKLEDKLKAIDEAIEYSEQWNQDQIQVGSAYFAKGRLLARLRPTESESCYESALTAFREAEMNAEIARTEIELASVLSSEANLTIFRTQGSGEWKFGLRVLGLLKVANALVLKDAILAGMAILLAILILVFLVNSR